MTEALRLSKLGDVGVITDITGSDLPAEAFTSGLNYSLKDGWVESYNGGNLISTCPVDIGITKSIVWIKDSGNVFIVMGSKAIYTFNGTTWVDVTPVGFPAEILDTYKFQWSACLSGKSVIICNPQIGPYYINDSVTLFTALPYSPTQTWQAHGKTPYVIRSHKEFLIGLGLKNIADETVNDRNAIAWSAPAEGSGIPFTWDPADLSTIAGELYLSGSGGYIIDGLTLRNEFCVYSKSSIDFMQYVGGELIWNIRPLSVETGLLALNSVVEIYNKHVMLTGSDILINDGNSLRSIVDRKIKTRIFNALNTKEYRKSFVAVNSISQEVYICIPESEYSYPNLAIVYNWATDQVYLRDTIPGCVDAQFGPKLSNMVTWASVTTKWNETSKTWETDKNSEFGNTFVFFDSMAAYNALELDVTKGFNTFLERVDVPLSGDGTSVTTVAMYPHIKCSGKVLIRMGASLGVGTGINWKQAQEFDPLTMRKVDIRTTGAFHSWRIQSIGNSKFSFSGMTIVYENNGVR